MTTDRSRHLHHRSIDRGVLLGRQTKREKLGFARMEFARKGFGARGQVGAFRQLIGRFRRLSFTHARTGHERSLILKNRSTFFGLVIPTLLNLVFSAQPAFGHEPPVFPPTKIDFDASRAPKDCNDFDTFKSILGAWVTLTMLREDAERRLVVRIQRSSTGGKQADASLVGADGTTIAERHADYGAAKECHYVLWDTAQQAAKLLGAFEPPPPNPPLTCATCPPCASCPSVRPCPSCPPLRHLASSIQSSPPPPRFFVGIGAFVGSGIFEKLGGGPQLLLGFVPSRHLQSLHIELESSWTSQSIESGHWQSIPFVGSVCWVRSELRFCGGFTMTTLYSNQFPNQEFRLLGPNFRIGTQLFNRGPFSVRADVFGRFAFSQRTLGMAPMPLADASPFAGGLAVVAGRSFD